MTNLYEKTTSKQYLMSIPLLLLAGMIIPVWADGILYVGSDTEEFNALPDKIGKYQTNGATIVGGANIPLGVGDFANGMTIVGGNLLTGTVSISDLTFRDLNTVPIAAPINADTPDAAFNEDLAYDGISVWRAYFENCDAGLITELDPNNLAGPALNVYIQEFGPVGMTFANGQLWTTDWCSQTVGTFDPTTNTYTPEFSTSDFGNSGCLAWDNDSLVLWVGTSGGWVVPYDLTGLQLDVAFQPFGAINDTIDGCTITQPVEVCSADEKICKSVEIEDADGDGIIEVGELITYTFTFTVSNNSGEDWTNVVVKDNFAADLDVIDPVDPDVTLTLKGNSNKESLSWNVGSLVDGASAELVLTAVTDLNPAGHQEYTSCSYHDINSGATLKYKDGNNKQQSASTEGITVSVLTDNATGDCDGDGFSDGVELSLGTDPHDPADFPACGGSSIVDICVDGDGIATAFPGSFSIIKGQALTTWPQGAFGPEGIDWFDNDASFSWTLGDDIHLEDPAGACSTAIRNAVHEVGFDCAVLDLDASLFTGQSVDCDLETGSFCGAVRLADLATVGIKFFDGEAIVDGVYNNGEDIIKDSNGNGIFD